MVDRVAAAELLLLVMAGSISREAADAQYIKTG